MVTLDEIQEIAEEAYVYAFPMLMGYRFGYATFLEPASPSYRGPANAGPYGEAVTQDHTFKDVITPNADTPYSFGLLDLRGGPVVLTVPDVTDRYYVMQFEDLLGQNDLFVGSRATSTAAGSYFLTGPRWEGDVPEGFAGSHQFETDLVFLLGRTQLLGADDQPALAEVMRQYRLEPYEVFVGGTASELPPFDWPVWNNDASLDERFIGYLNALLPLCGPVHPDETELFDRFASIGIGAGMPFAVESLSDDQRQAVRRGIAAGREAMMAAMPDAGRTVNGWVMSDAFGDRDFFDGRYDLRAMAAQLGWGGNDQIEALYPISHADPDGEPYDGSHTYQMTLVTDPPVNAFWSITMYDTSYDGEAGYLVENSIDRYLINSTTRGLIRNDAGGLTITIQHTEPENPTERANWLPSPEGSFYLSLRLYWPKPEALDGTWNPPPVVRID